ncbi:PepSY domain-containing protein [Paracoccus aestuariivivens]|uniref:PepSY domain-containing protein n=1 Tax=Paracoccus aestuariivivens TaxID=1820333 RepID=A0A6L6JD48_9RHOB|nr:hypothetical protein [Paracoccus aestuariivivens]MTH80113.1 hypothetical protein [Paracoccus aestuariivivens]
MPLNRTLLSVLLIAAQLMTAGLACAQGRGGPGSGPAGGPHADRSPHGGRSDPHNPRGPNKPELSDQDAALMARESREAVPLERIVETLRRSSVGQVIDAALIRRGGTLYYRLTVLEPSGDVRDTYFIARSGQPVELE